MLNYKVIALTNQMNILVRAYRCSGRTKITRNTQQKAP